MRSPADGTLAQRTFARWMFPPRLARLGVVLAGVLVVALMGAAPAFAGAWWRLSARAAPTLLIPGQKATIAITATNVGDGGVNATSTPVTIKDVLPAGLQASEIRGEPAFHKEASHLMSCELATLTCTSKPEVFPAFERLEVTIVVNVEPGASNGEQNLFSVQGGEQENQPGAPVPALSLARLLSVGDQPTQFGVEEHGYALSAEEEGGTLDDLAGSHPFQLTTSLDLDQVLESNPKTGPTQAAPALPRNLQFSLPPGLIGDPQAVPSCPTVDFLAISETATNACKAQSAIGVVVVTLDEPNHFGDITRAVPLWNLEPAHGEPARFGFEALKVPVVLDASLRSSGDYGVTVTVSNAPQAAQILASEVTIWSTPAATVHDQSRGWACLLGGVYFNHEVPCESESQTSPVAFLTMPTSCAGATYSIVEGQSWPLQTIASEPGQIFTLQGPNTEDELHGYEECQRLPFTPTINAEPVEEQNGQSVTAHSASSPMGLDVGVHVSQQSTLEPGGLAEADVQSTSVTLPEGVQLNPSAADGLKACTEQQIGYEGPAGTDPLSPQAAQSLRFSSAPAECPEASKVGLVHIKTPLLEDELQGAVYLASPAPAGEAGQNPFDSLLALYIVAEDPAAGIRVKLAGETRLQEQTGQITSSFRDTPQVPFEELRLELFAGARASLATPAICRTYSAEALFTPWSGTPAVSASSPAEAFDIDAGSEGSPCTSAQPFAPSFRAGATNVQAGAFTSFTVQIARSDREQPITGLTVHLPVGNAAILASVTPCGEPQAAQGTCGPESEIGQATATSGVGPDPYTVSGGRVYITGPYDGAPFGLSIVTPAIAGPFNLGNVVVRSQIFIDPHTAQVTISSGLPTIVQGVGRPASGVPLDLREIYVDVDRHDFEFNPTSCSPLSITATLTGAQGASAGISNQFHVAECQNLPFKPTVTASTQGQTSKLSGASLGLKFASAQGQANVAKTVLTIPAILPARLSTIQQACRAAVFEANPAACPEGSDIGTAVVHTPVLKNPVVGPIYLVSHGNAAWPDAELVLQGEGITVILDGQTAIKKGITTSSFLSVPDVPFETVQANLPEGPHSALTTNLPAKDHYSLCGQSLTIPTTLTGQNATVVNENVGVAVQDCRTVKPAALTRAQKLALALKACHSKYVHARSRRAACERVARHRYAARKAAHKTRTTIGSKAHV